DYDNFGPNAGYALVWHPSHPYADGGEVVDYRTAIDRYGNTQVGGPAVGGAVAAIELLIDDGRVVRLDYTDDGLQYADATSSATNPNSVVTCLPTSTTDDGKFLYIGGNNMQTFPDEMFQAWINTRSDSGEPLYVDIYDGDMDGFFDISSSAGSCFRLIPSPAPGWGDEQT